MSKFGGDLIESSKEALIMVYKARIELLERELAWAKEGWHVEMPNADTVWNAAIEAAAEECGHQLSTEDGVYLASDIMERILDLKRRTE